MGILLGGLYVIIALGLSLVFGVMRLINLAHGDLLILGAYLSYTIWISSGIGPHLKSGNHHPGPLRPGVPYPAISFEASIRNLLRSSAYYRLWHLAHPAKF